ncbi:unnamed protein product, partial [marine sediment metagenome]
AEVITYSTHSGTSHIQSALFGTYPDRGDWPTIYSYIDDITINNRSGEATANPMEDLRYDLLVPNATGTYSQWMGM